MSDENRDSGQKPNQPDVKTEYGETFADSHSTMEATEAAIVSDQLKPEQEIQEAARQINPALEASETGVTPNQPEREISDKAREIKDNVGETMDKAKDWTTEKAAKTEKWLGEKSEQAKQWADENTDRAKDLIDKKKGEFKNWAGKTADKIKHWSER